MTYNNAAIKLHEKYSKLKTIALGANNFHFGIRGDVYQGPISPKGFVMEIDPFEHAIAYRLVLAERVPIEFVDPEFEGGPSVITANLDSNFEFALYDPISKSIGHLLFHNYEHDGTLWDWMRSNGNSPTIERCFTLIYYEHEGSGYTGLSMFKRLIEKYNKPV